MTTSRKARTNNAAAGQQQKDHALAEISMTPQTI
jgi:hypothetical protein